MSENIEMLNRKMCEFIDDLTYSFPEFNDFKLFKNMLEMAIYIDKRSPHKMFDDTIAKLYRDKIISKNEDFFLDEQYNASYNDINLINKLKAVWKTIDNGNKETIWQYLNVLLILNDRCKSI